MTRFLSISSFRKRLADLLKVRRGVYAGVKSEICTAFRNATIEQIRQNRDMILMNNESVVIKLRLPDKRQRLSRSDGYRLVYMVLKTAPVVVLLDIYPKRGPSQQLDIEDNELNMLILEFVSELKSKKLLEHDIENDLNAKQ